MSLSAGGRKTLGLTPQQMKERKKAQTKAAKRRRRELVNRMEQDGIPLCRHGLCIAAPNESGLCDRHEAIKKSNTTGRICIKCSGLAMPHSTYCGFHFEEAEERRSARQKAWKRRNAA